MKNSWMFFSARGEEAAWIDCNGTQMVACVQRRPRASGFRDRAKFTEHGWKEKRDARKCITIKSPPWKKRRASELHEARVILYAYCRAGSAVCKVHFTVTRPDIRALSILIIPWPHPLCQLQLAPRAFIIRCSPSNKTLTDAASSEPLEKLSFTLLLSRVSYSQGLFDDYSTVNRAIRKSYGYSVISASVVDEDCSLTGQTLITAQLLLVATQLALIAIRYQPSVVQEG